MPASVQLPSQPTAPHAGRELAHPNLLALVHGSMPPLSPLESPSKPKSFTRSYNMLQLRTLLNVQLVHMLEALQTPKRVFLVVADAPSSRPKAP